MKPNNTTNKESVKIDELWLITAVCFVVCTTFWLGASSQLQDFWSTIQNAFVVLAVCYTVERAVVVSLPCLQRPRVTLHFGFGIVQNIIYVATFLASPSTFAEIWTSVYFGYYLWTWIVLVAHHQEFFTIFRIFFTVHHTVSFFITGTWILVAAHCDCPYNLYLLRGIVLWLAADIWGYILNFTRSIYPGIPVRTIRRLQLMIFFIDRIQKSSAYIQAIAITGGNMNALDWTVFGTGFFNDILDASFQIHSLYSYYRKEQDHTEPEKTNNSDIESGRTTRAPNSSIIAALGNDSQTTTTGKFPKPFVSSPPELKDLLLLPEFDKTTQWELLPKDFQRLTQERLKLVAQTGAFQISRGPGMGSGNTTEPEAFMRLLDAFHWAGLFDLSLFDVVGVHAIGGNVVFIHGDDSQLAENRAKIDQIEDVYCFGATELAHGSNLKQIQTIAEFDDKTNEVVLITPSSTACKYWIGNSTFVADYVVVLSRLVVKGEEQGIGWLRVPLWKNKDKTERFPGIHVRDTGAKAGCNGIGNGCITFDHVRLPRSALLSRFCQVDENGDFQSALSSSDLFLRSIQTFVLERIGVATAAIGCAKSAIHVALSYAAVRHQFGPDGDEVPLISYPMHQRRLISHAVRLFVGKATVDRIGRAAQESFHPYEFGADRKKLHADSCLVKAFASWESFAAAQEARELCGGHSFAATSQLGMARNDLDVTLTFAGDNSLLALEVVRHRLKGIKEWPILKKLFGPIRPLNRHISPSDHDDDPVSLMQKCLRLLIFREETMLLTVGKKLMAKQDQGFRAFTEHSFEMREVAGAVYDRMCVETWLEQQMDQGQLYCDIGVLDALQRVQKNEAWFLLRSALSKATHEAVEAIIKKIISSLGRQHECLLDAFCVPHDLVRHWPLGQPDYCQRLHDLTYEVSPLGQIDHCKRLDDLTFEV